MCLFCVMLVFQSNSYEIFIIWVIFYKVQIRLFKKLIWLEQKYGNKLPFAEMTGKDSNGFGKQEMKEKKLQIVDDPMKEVF